jgi:tRNA (guanine37-N1)-methyltransferase
MGTHKEVKSVWRQVSSVSGDYRLRSLEFLLGEQKTETVYREHGCVYKTDLKKAYFSPRLSYERMRIAGLTQPGETVLNMFAGVGCFSVALAKHAKPLKVYSVDINPCAYEYLRENVRLNRVEKTVIPIQGDAKHVTEERLRNVADRVLMPLPERAYDYLDVALLALKPEGGRIHYHDFVHSNRKEAAVKKVEAKVTKKLNELSPSAQVLFGRVVRPIGPGWYHVVLDIQAQKPLTSL